MTAARSASFQSNRHHLGKCMCLLVHSETIENVFKMDGVSWIKNHLEKLVAAEYGRAKYEHLTDISSNTPLIPRMYIQDKFRCWL